jgi:hypothetical protein
MKVESKEGAKPPPELEALDYFVGIWSCAGRLEAHGDEPAREVKGSMICRWELGKYYLGVAEDDEQSLTHPRRRQGRAYWGYDPGTKQYTSAVFFFGGARYIATSPGWRSDVLTFSGEMISAGERIAMHQSFTQKSDSELIIRADVAGPDGKLVRRLLENCRREGEG